MLYPSLFDSFFAPTRVIVVSEKRLQAAEQKARQEQLEALELGIRYLKMSSYPEVARWLTDYTGRRITPMGLWKRVKRDASDRRKHVEQKRRAAQAASQGNIQTQN